jgi:endonuclease V-like protein UPF0215 family
MPNDRISNVIGFDDAPFVRGFTEKVQIVGTVYAGPRLDGVLIGEIERDGFDAAGELIRLIRESRFLEHIRLVMLQGITLGGFNVVDVFALNRELNVPVLVACRKQPDMGAVRKALLTRIPRGKEKWELIEKVGPMEPVENIFIQRIGLSPEQAAAVIRQFTIHSQLPEPIRTAHLIAGALSTGHSRGAP